VVVVLQAAVYPAASLEAPQPGKGEDSGCSAFLRAASLSAMNLRELAAEGAKMSEPWKRPW